MMKKLLLALIAVLLISVPALAGSIAEEHEKARQGGYEKQYEEQMERNQGSRTKEEHDKYHQNQEKNSNNYNVESPNQATTKKNN